ncbi:MAG TPA: sulfatase [Vicinamibacteria bacterium]|nr:sulfatase [Vicinamibacteria bacterium]
MSTRLVANAAAATLLLLTGCGPSPGSAMREAPGAPATASRPNIVLLVLDAVRADHLGIYGYERETMPFLAGRAAGGLVFERAYAPSSWTPSSMASIFTGVWPHQHGVRTGFAATRNALKRGEAITLNRIPSRLLTLPAMLKRAGYRTFGASDNFNVGDAMGFTRGFDEFSAKDQGGLRRGEAVREWREALLGGAPYFLYLHYMAAHAPYHKRAPWYDPNTPGHRQSVAAYDSNLSFLDERIRELHELLAWDERTLLVVTADHGEEFRDHGGAGHTNTLYQELLHVPLVVCWPGRVDPGRIRTPVSTIDLMPSLREAAGQPPDARDQGRSLFETARGGGDPARVVFAMRWDEVGKDRSTKKAVVTERHKLILTLPEARVELYDLIEDPREKSDLSRHKAPLVAALRRQLDELEARTAVAEREFSPAVSFTRENAEELKALGYVQ